jgi:ligand-binding sensor domain-containing protein/signal transduction histidine kinase/DNA-binding response OmpR family regulator
LAQYDPNPFYRLTTQEGLAHDMVQCILQDAHGFLWFGTKDGLNRYDGHQFLTFRHSPQDSNSLTDNDISALYQDRAGLLWVGTQYGGLNSYDPRTHQFTDYHCPFWEKRAMQGNPIRVIYQDQRGYLWVGCKWGDLCRFDPRQRTFQAYPQLGDNISAIHEDEEGQLWMASHLGDLYQYHPQRDAFVAYPNDQYQPDLISSDYTSFIQELASGEFLVGTSAAIFAFDRDKPQFSPFKGFQAQVGSFRNNEMRCFLEVPARGQRPTQYWIGTWGKGLYQLDSLGNPGAHYQKRPNNRGSLSNNDVNALYYDRSGVLWIATQDGLNKLDPARQLFQHYQNDAQDPQSLSLNFVTSFAEETAQQALWIGTFGGGINRMDLQTGHFTHLGHEEGNGNSLTNDAVRVLRHDPHHGVWIGTMDGLDCYHPQQQRFTHYRHQPGRAQSLASNDIMALVIDSTGRLWIGTYGGGLDCFDPKGGTFTHYRHDAGQPNGLSSNYIRSLCFDQRGYLWVGTLGGGLNRLNPQSGQVRTFRHDPTNPRSLNNDYINSIYQDQRGQLWVGTYAGLGRFEPQSQDFLRITEAEGLCHNRITEILDDDAGHLWVSTFKGLTQLTFPAEGQPGIMNYTLNHNIQGNVFNVNAALKLQQGALLFGGTNGFNRFQPQDMQLDPYQPPVYLTGLSLDNLPVEIGESRAGRVLLPQALMETQQLNLDYSDNIITLEFSSPSYSLPSESRYAYRLEGIDEDWVEVGADRRFATYTNLNPGSYRFRVRSATHHGVWNQTEAQLTLLIAPPWWQTWWAYLLYALLIGGLLYAFQKYTIIKTNLKSTLMMEHMEQEKREEIHRHKLQFFTNISHEFRTPLTLILGPVNQLLHQETFSAEVRQQLQLMNRNASRLLHLINQLMSFRKVETGNERLQAAPQDIVSVTQDIFQVFMPIAQQKDIDYQFQSTLDYCQLWIDRGKVETILYNLLSNAFKHTPNGGCIQVQLSGKASEVVLEVLDNGRGIPAQEIEKVFDRYYSQDGHTTPLQESTGIGLSLIKNLVTLHHGHIIARSHGVSGAAFRVSLPMGHRHLHADQKSEALSQPSSLPLWMTALLDTTLIPTTDEAPTPDNRRPHILVAEDNDDLRVFLTQVLSPQFQVSAVEDGEQALAFLANDLPDLVLTDVMMPGVNGWELCQRIKSDIRSSHLPVVMLTARTEHEAQLQGMATGADDYMTKPFHADVLLLKIQNLLDTREKLRESFRRETILTPSDVTSTSTDEAFLQQAVNVVEDHIADSTLDAGRFCELLNLSTMQVYRKLKALTGQSANEFIRTIRLKRAAQMLQDSTLNVSEIAYDVGFNDPKYFTKCFSKHFGETPTAYRLERA